MCLNTTIQQSLYLICVPILVSSHDIALGTSIFWNIQHNVYTWMTPITYTSLNYLNRQKLTGNIDEKCTGNLKLIVDICDGYRRTVLYPVLKDNFAIYIFLMQCWIHLCLYCSTTHFNPIQEFQYIPCPFKDKGNVTSVLCHFLCALIT